MILSPELKLYIRSFSRPVGIFFLGVVYDVLTLTRIDDTFGLIQTAIFLFVMFALHHRELHPTAWPWSTTFGVKLENWYDDIGQFIQGSLLSAHTIFYLKSASLAQSFLFLLLIILLLVINETRFRSRWGESFKMGLTHLNALIYLSYLIPILIGTLHEWMTYIILILYPIFFLLLFKTQRKILMPSVLSPAALLCLFMLFGIIPPMPLSLKNIGAYYQVEKKEGNYHLTIEKKWWQWFKQSEKHFYAYPGDSLYIFVSIFSPTDFRSQIYLVWQRLDGPDTETSDRIPIQIQGGRAEGHRGYAYKKNYATGEYRVLVQTSSGREIGRYNFTVTKRFSPAPRDRAFSTLIF